VTLPLTPKQERVWRYILSCERSPTYDEIAQHIGARSRTTAFRAVAALVRQPDVFRDDANAEVSMGLGYWTRANSEPCLLATRGKPKRRDGGVKQGIIEPKREHSRKPDCVPGRIERLVEGPYLELFARTQRPGWTVWGNQTDKFVSEAA
jgi:hypothetical protein